MTHLQRLKAILLHRELYLEYLRTGDVKTLQRANGAITANNADVERWRKLRKLTIRDRRNIRWTLSNLSTDYDCARVATDEITARFPRMDWFATFEIAKEFYQSQWEISAYLKGARK